MINRVLKRFIALMLAAVLLVSLAPTFTLTAFAATSGDLTGLSNSDIGASWTGTDDGSNVSWSANVNTIIGSVIGTSGMCSSTQYETTLTITNNKTSAATLSFDYAIAQNSGTIQVDGTAVTADGTYSKELAAGGSIKVYLKSGSTSTATTITLSNVNLLANVDAVTTFQPSEHGSYTADGIAITEETQETKNSFIAYTLVAIPDSGYKFVGWYSVTGSKYLSSDTSTALNFDSDQTITAIFTEEFNPVFDVSGAKFTDLNEANTYAVENSQSKITLVSDGTLSSGSYTISSGVILLIPFDEQGTCYTTAPANTGNVRTAPSVYRKLTMAEGASITVNGSISVSAKHYAYGQNGAGAPDGKYGYIYMENGSSITANNGGALYVYGFVSGEGTVTAKPGAVVYENMQICDFRGGNATSSMNNNKQKIFPLNQYFIQNIEAKLILESGADEYIYTSIYASNTSTSTAVHFIGNSGAMFSIDEGGSFTKRYLPDQDRLEITINGDAKINNLTLTVMGISISSGNYVLPITNCMTLNVNSGTTQITQDVALLAGVQVNIANGATVQLTSGSSMYVYDADEWTAANYASNAKFKTVLYSPTRTYTRKASDLIDARIDINGTLQADGYIYTTAGGADIINSERTGTVIMTNGAGTETATYMYKDYTTTYDTIPVTSAKLHNGSAYTNTDEEYTITSDAVAGDSYVYSESEDKWVKDGGATKVTVTFNANGGTGTMDAQTFTSGEAVALTANTFTRDGYTFSGWNTSADGSGTSYADSASVTLDADTTLYAQWTANTYTVTWVDEDGTELEKDENVAYGTTPEYNGETPTKQGDAQYSYTFTGWTPDVAAVTADVTYKAVYEQSVNQYTITWTNWDGTELKSEQVAYGEVPSYTGDAPTKEGDAEHNYTFSGWTPEITAVTGDATYTATFTEGVNTYTIIWQDWDGTELEKDENVAYGTTPEYNGETPTRTGDNQYSYTFKGWSPATDTVTGDITYTAVYEQTVNQYTIIWKNGEDVLKTEQVAYGETPVWSGETPTKTDSTGQYTYTFRGWTPEISVVTCDATYTAEFDQVENTFTVTWLDSDGATVLEKDENVAWGSKPSFDNGTPTKAEDDQYTYTFTGWNPEITDETTVTTDVTYTAVYESTVKTYTVTWKNADGTILETDENVAYGTMPSYDGATPTKAANSDYTYTFNGWDPAIASVTGDVTYTATYTSTAIVKHTVTFDANGGEGSMDVQTFVVGVDTRLTVNAFTREGYKFTGWNTAADGSGASYADEGAIIDLQEDITLYAQWQFWNGWLTDNVGTTYYTDGEIAYQSAWATIDAKTYYFNESGYIVKGLYKTTSQDGSHEATFVFDTSTGEFLSTQSGLFNVGSDTYWTKDGELVEEAGLQRIVKENGEINYYYFATAKNVEENPNLVISKAVKNLLPDGGTDCWIHKTNGLPLPEWGYWFDANGVILHNSDTTRNGVYEDESGIKCYYVDGVKAPAGLVKIGDDYYYAKSNGAVVVDGTYYCSRMNSLMDEGTYAFDADGKMLIGATSKNGIVAENNSLYYYVNGTLTYAGLIEIDGDYYYVRSNGEVVHNQLYYITWTHGLKPQASYVFDESGKLLREARNGIVAEDGSLFYYRDDRRFYAGLIQIDGDYYYVRGNCEVVHSCTYTITWTHDLLPQASYTFDESGKMILDNTNA